MEPVRRDDDGELCGHIDEDDGAWRALTIFGAVLGTHGDQDDAQRQVLEEGLASLAERWTLRNGATGDEEVVCIQEANPGSVTLIRGYYPEVGVPMVTISARQLASGAWSLHR